MSFFMLRVRRPRVAHRRAWALETLRRHTEENGTCAYCSSHYGYDAPWPCPPARVAELYRGLPSPQPPS